MCMNCTLTCLCLYPLQIVVVLLLQRKFRPNVNLGLELLETFFFEVACGGGEQVGVVSN
jgi:hypothetical protein